MNKQFEESTRRRTDMEDWTKKLQESTNMNIRNQNDSLKNLETQVEQLIKDYQAKDANEVSKKMDEGPSGVLQCQLPLKELSPGSFTLLYTIGSLNIYAMADLGDPNDTMILGRLFLATIHARINVFHEEISLGIREDRIMFNINGNVHHPTIPIEKVYLAKSNQEEESFNPLEIRNDLFSYDSPLGNSEDEKGRQRWLNLE
ncbi:hypothetical protein Tco_0414627 [Tanacetum coccineum]